jgi:hypothetical protein
VTARTPTPAAAASSTSAAGAREPSEATVWVWRSARLGGVEKAYAATASPARPRASSAATTCMALSSGV